MGANAWAWPGLSPKRTTDLADVHQAEAGDIVRTDVGRDGAEDHRG